MLRFEEFLDEWADFFLSERTFTVLTEPTHKTAKIENLKDDYKQLAQSLLGRVNSPDERQECEIVVTFINEILSIQETGLVQLLGPAGDKERIGFSLPIISKRNLEQIKRRSLQTQETSYWSLIGLAAIIFELQMLRTDILAILSARNVPVFLFVFQQYAAIRLHKRHSSNDQIKRLINDEASKTVKSKMDAQSSQFNELTHRIDSLQASAIEVDDRLKKGLHEAASKAVSDIENNKASIIASFKEDAANAVLEVKESAKLEKARLQWKSKRNGHCWSFWLSLTVLLFALICIPYQAIASHAEIINFVAKVSNLFAQSLNPIANSSSSQEISLGVELIRQVGKLFFLTVPLVIYFWICRLVVRYVLRSLVLMDDASQRRVVLDTYLNLISEGVAKEDDRQLLLQAIFAPLPGHGEARIDLPIPTQPNG
ncbi:hypothetical protein [Pseudovibrio sp. Tun.PSC04-5.I4]|uniref:hypothetical protein n=1 Tax=Pseudovibrio sp. Tun.PSC04-5.I4 TaxID=1798213 RepID=UPI0008819EE7|nr:hypothetical protein [Pseudovibrio sp. Tun.PSC04-5.I4]SDR30733.1 hypothetical protein SAMN04515695_4325 [Pseudovibrio sp. Tun.PSC04-5.I4]